MTLTGTLCVFNATKQSFLGMNVGRASSQFARLRGLMGMLPLRRSEGLWTVPSQGIHTVGLTFPIDIVYLDAECRVVHLVENLSPFRLAPVKFGAHSVLQLAAHAIHASRTQLGDQLLICPPEELRDSLERLRDKQLGKQQESDEAVMERHR